MNFRGSDEEYELINKKIELSQMSKQYYFIQLFIEHEISVRSDYRVSYVISIKILDVEMIEKYRRNIPLEPKLYNQWLWFKKIKNTDKKGKVKTIKIPISPITLSSKGWNLREQWEDFETAINGLPNSGCDRLSFILTKNDHFICIDVDNISEDKKILIDDFSDVYIEISQFGKGLHIFVKEEIADNFNN